MARGRFITLEGGEGVGKSTQARALAAALETRGLNVVLTREPGGSAGAEAIRALLLQGAADRWSVRAEALLFAAARSDHVSQTILPAMAAGQWVVCDRFIDSSRAYQGVGGAMCDADILALHTIGSGGLMPDRTLLLELDQAQVVPRLQARDGAGSDRIGGRDAAFHAQVHAAFGALAAQEPERIRPIAAHGPIEDVTARLLVALADLLP
jgi:dTMP kinase